MFLCVALCGGSLTHLPVPASRARRQQMVCSAVLCSVAHVRTPHARAHRLTARLSLHARRPNWRKCASCARSEACVHPCVHACGMPCFHIQHAQGLPVDAAPSAGASSVAAESESVTDLVSSILGPAGARTMRSGYCINNEILSCSCCLAPEGSTGIHPCHAGHFVPSKGVR
jgi:hypothetical protein